ncbi:hypothetical protein WI99_23945 [Burkholderia cepacia]|nr:hypothetical protein WI99_23945 [Burkholderia cepacia]
MEIVDSERGARGFLRSGKRLSLQMHHHRAGHWIVVRGTARVTRVCETFLLCENEIEGSVMDHRFNTMRRPFE